MRLDRSSLRHAAALAAAVLLAACSSSKSSTPPPAGSTFTGTLIDGALLTVQVPTAVVTAATITLTGTVRSPVGNALYGITGSYDTLTGTLTLTTATTPGYSVTGTFTNGVLSGSCTLPDGTTGPFVAMNASAGAVTRYCGTYDGDAAGAIQVMVSGARGVGVVAVAPDAELVGTLSGATLVLLDPSTVVTGTLASGTFTGTWTHGASAGTWTASTAACEPTVVPCPTAQLSGNPVTHRLLEPTVPHAAAGGTIVPGTYVESAVNEYGTSLGVNTSRRYMVVAGNTLTMVEQEDQDPEARISATFTYSSANAKIVFTISQSGEACVGDPQIGPPPGAVVEVPYTAAGNTLTLYLGRSNQKETIFTRQ